MNCTKQAERAGPLFKKSVTIEDIKMLIKILNQKLDVAIKAEFSFSNGDYTNVNTEEMLETKSDSYERVKKSKMSADAAEFVPMSHKIGFSCNGEISRNAGLMKQLANSYTDRDSPDDVSYAFTNENNSAGVKLISEDSREENETIKDERKQGDENPNPSEENHFVNTELEAKDYADSCDIDQQPKTEESNMQVKRGLDISNEDIFESPKLADIEIPDNDEKNSLPVMSSTKSENENINLCNDYLDKTGTVSEEENQNAQFALDNIISAESEQIFNLDNKNFSALDKNADDSSTLECQYSLDVCAAKAEEEFQTSSDIQDKEDVKLKKHFHANIIGEKNQKLKMESEVDIILGESQDIEDTDEKMECMKKDEMLEEFVEASIRDMIPKEDQAEEFVEESIGDMISKKDQAGEFVDESIRDMIQKKDQAEESVEQCVRDMIPEEDQAEESVEESIRDMIQKEEAGEENTQSHQKPTLNSVKNKLQAQIIEAIRCEMNTNDISPCKLFEETMKDTCRQETSDDDNDLSNDSIELEIVPETIKCQWNSHLTNRMLAYSLHLKFTELANIYKAWTESTPPILPTKFWSMKKQNSYTMQSIAENISLVCLKCEVVQMKLEAEQQKLKYEEIDKKMQLSFQKESKNTNLQKKLEEAWKKATKTEEMLSHKIWAKRKNWFNIFALFYQKPNVIVPRPKTFERARRPFFSSTRERSRLFYRRAWRR